MATTFIGLHERTGDLSAYPTVQGTVAVVTDVVRDATRSIRCTTGGAGANASVRTSVIVQAGGRISVAFRLTNLPTGNLDLIRVQEGGVSRFSARITSAGVLQLVRGVTQMGSDGATLSTGTWYRLCLSYTVTSTSINEFRLFLDGSQTITASNGALGGAAVDGCEYGWCTSSVGNSLILHITDDYIDNSTSLTDTGDIHTAAKFPAATNTNNFDSTIGTGTNRWDYVDERPISESNGLQHAASSDVQENFTLEGSADGDVDLTGATLVARTAWLWAKRGTFTAIEPLVAGAEGSAGSGNINLGAPASPSNNDIWIAAVHSRDNVAHTFTDWTQIAQFNGGGTTSRLSIWYFRYAGSTPNLTVGHTAGDTIVGGIFAFRGCKTSGSPVNGTGSNSTGTGTQTITGMTPSVRDCMTLAITGRGDDDSYDAVTGWDVCFEDTAGGTQRNYGSSTGGDGSVGIYRQLQTTAADTGSVTASTAATDAWAGLMIALEPADTVGSPDIMDNGSETAITLTSASALYTKITDSASYPSNAAGIGIRSGGGTVDTYLYECGTVIAYRPPHVGAGAVTVSTATASGDATFTGVAETYTADAAVTVSTVTADGSATFTAPVYTGDAAVTVATVTAAGSATFAPGTHTATAAVTITATTASGDATFVAPVYTADAAVTVATVTAAGSATFSPGTKTATAAVTVTAATADGSATFVAPVYTGTAAVSIATATAAGSATFTAPVYDGTAAVTVANATAAGVVDVTNPSYTGDAAVTVTAATAAGDAIFSASVSVGSAAVTVSIVTASGSATFTAPVYDGNATVTVATVTASGDATFTAPVYDGTAAVTVSMATASGSASFTPVPVTASGAVTVSAATASGLAIGPATEESRETLDRIGFVSPADAVDFETTQDLIGFVSASDTVAFEETENRIRFQSNVDSLEF